MLQALRMGYHMKITAARVIVTCPGRNFVTLKIETDQGVYGIGDGTLNGRELSVVAYLEEHVIPCLIGMDPRRIEDVWQYLYRGAYWRRGPVTMRAIAAVDMALWDIKAKMAGMPLYQLLGGRSRDGVMVYGHANGSDIAETVEAVGASISTWATRRSAPRPGCRGSRTPTGSGAASCSTNPPMPPALGHRLGYPQGAQLCPQAVREAARDLRLRPSPAPRWPPPLYPAGSGQPWQDAGALPAVLAGGLHPGGKSGGLQAGPPAHCHAAGGGRDFQHRVGRQGSDPEPADRLYPLHGGRRGRDHASAPDRRSRRAISDPHRLPRRDRPVAGHHGLRTAFRYLGAQFRHSGIYAPHRRKPTRSSRTTIT